MSKVVNEDSNLSGDEMGSQTAADLEDVEILKMCSRQDLFEMLRTDPEYYLKLIQDNKLGDQLMVKVSRSSDGGGLRIKFRVYPEDRWTEVGYFGDCGDDEVLDDFKVQITSLMSRSRKEVDSSRTGHLDSQLDGNNDITSQDYGRDIPGLNQKRLEFRTPLEKQLDAMGMYGNAGGDYEKKDTKSGGSKKEKVSAIPRSERKVSRRQDDVREESRVESRESSRDSLLAEVKSIWISAILEKLPSLVSFDEEAVSNLPNLVGELGNCDVPSGLVSVHSKLLDRLHEHMYLVQLFQTGMFQVDSLRAEMREFLEGCMKASPIFFMDLSWDVVESDVLDQDDQAVLARYGLTIQGVWQEYLRSLSNSESDK